MKFLVQYDENWSDEMDVEGYSIIEEPSLASLHVRMHKEYIAYSGYENEDCGEDPNFEYTVGSNQYIDYDNFDHAMKRYKITVISDDEAAVITKFLGACRGHTGPFV